MSLLYQKLIHKVVVILLLFSCCFVGASEMGEQTLSPLLDYLSEMANHHRMENGIPPPIVAVGGCPGVGKTHLTQILAKALQENGVRCQILLFDDFILASRDRKKMDTLWDIRHFKVDELKAVLGGICSGKKQLQKPTRNPLTGETATEIVDLSKADLILFDGLYALCSKSPLDFYEYCVAGVYVEADEADIYHWRWEREKAKASPRTQEQFNTIMKVYFDDFHDNIEYSKSNADFIIKKDGEHHYDLKWKQIHQAELIKEAA